MPAQSLNKINFPDFTDLYKTYGVAQGKNCFVMYDSSNGCYTFVAIDDNSYGTYDLKHKNDGLYVYSAYGSHRFYYWYVYTPVEGETPNTTGWGTLNTHDDGSFGQDCKLINDYQYMVWSNNDLTISDGANTKTLARADLCVTAEYDPIAGDFGSFKPGNATIVDGGSGGDITIDGYDDTGFRSDVGNWFSSLFNVIIYGNKDGANGYNDGFKEATTMIGDLNTKMADIVVKMNEFPDNLKGLFDTMAQGMDNFSVTINSLKSVSWLYWGIGGAFTIFAVRKIIGR